MRERIALSIPTQTAMKGLRDAARLSLCRSAMKRHFRNRFRRFLKLADRLREKSVIPASWQDDGGWFGAD
jgi:hypothetical protein